jgi:hypothetical protein
MIVGYMTQFTGELAHVVGGANSFGRCGPGSGWQFLGNVYTPQCLAHDKAVRDAKAAGATTVQAHLSALPKLPAAIGSYFRSIG